MIGRYRCDHCGWTGIESDRLPHPRLGDPLCPDCWRDGFETTPRAEWSDLMEAVLEPEPSPRTPKAIIDWTDEEWRIADRIAAARAAHERSDVRLETSIEHASQLGFEFMRPEFRVANGREGKKGRR